MQYDEGDEATEKGSQSDPVDPRGKGWAGFDVGTEPAGSNDALSSSAAARTVKAKPGAIVGEVRGLQSRTETALDRPRIVWTFRLERYDAAGNRLRPVSVEIKGFEFHGSINEGDLVEVKGDPAVGVLAVAELHNHTTGSRVTADDKTPNILGCAAAIVVFVLIAIGIAIYLNQRFEQDIRERQRTSEHRSKLESWFATEPSGLEIRLSSNARSGRPRTYNGDLILAAQRREDR